MHSTTGCCEQGRKVSGFPGLRTGPTTRPKVTKLCGGRPVSAATSLAWLRMGPLVDGAPGQPELLATGYSCRSQVDRLRGQRLRHPLEVLLQQCP